MNLRMISLSGFFFSVETVRLVGSKESSGRVEIFYKHQWGTICNDQFDNKDAVVICKMLGL